MKAFDWQLHKKGYIPMSGQIVDASLVPAPKQRNTDAEKDAIKAGKSAAEIWPDAPNKAAQKDTNARWTLKVGGKVRYRPDGTPLPMTATPVFGYKSHISIDRRFGFIRESAVTSAATPDGRMLRQLVSDENTSMEVWADTAYRSQGNEKWLAKNDFISSIHRRKPNGKGRDRRSIQGEKVGYAAPPHVLSEPSQEPPRVCCMRAQRFFAAVPRESARRRRGNCSHSSKPQQNRTRQNANRTAWKIVSVLSPSSSFSGSRRMIVVAGNRPTAAVSA